MIATRLLVFGRSAQSLELWPKTDDEGLVLLPGGWRLRRSPASATVSLKPGFRSFSFLRRFNLIAIEDVRCGPGKPGGGHNLNHLVLESDETCTLPEFASLMVGQIVLKPGAIVEAGCEL